MFSHHQLGTQILRWKQFIEKFPELVNMPKFTPLKGDDPTYPLETMCFIYAEYSPISDILYFFKLCLTLKHRFLPPQRKT